MKTLLIIFAFILVSCSRDIKIACVGDSITEGFGLANQSRTAYPPRLDSILGTGYSVMNCGRSAATLQKKGDLPYWECKEFYDVFALILISLLSSLEQMTLKNKTGIMSTLKRITRR
jgi:hypothetical protein